jgi:hypothetical protein
MPHAVYYIQALMRLAIADVVLTNRRVRYSDWLNRITELHGGVPPARSRVVRAWKNVYMHPRGMYTHTHVKLLVEGFPDTKDTWTFRDLSLCQRRMLRLDRVHWWLNEWRTWRETLEAYSLAHTTKQLDAMRTQSVGEYVGMMSTIEPMLMDKPWLVWCTRRLTERQQFRGNWVDMQWSMKKNVRIWDDRLYRASDEECRVVHAYAHMPHYTAMVARWSIDAARAAGFTDISAMMRYCVPSEEEWDVEDGEEFVAKDDVDSSSEQDDDDNDVRNNPLSWRRPALDVDVHSKRRSTVFQSSTATTPLAILPPKQRVKDSVRSSDEDDDVSTTVSDVHMDVKASGMEERETDDDVCMLVGPHVSYTTWNRQELAAWAAV